jgi:hypothetical protein
MAVLRELGESEPIGQVCIGITLYRRGLLLSGKAADLLGM